ncbi:LOW QUALITY PROTEIN: hypothetical protein, conserved [Eimeria necatrix]|uniref:Uncharacterized protein n=1 Tax=Eimeria necatrix TaxID=51315 RepID=U6MVV7_9EIME|nr:LOW QUALITY PROTEIN: hypothetical protein, conserved [Eimeria necatrix]CDJ66614.1 hypothetical protein, conserved [Eimeria necatrix]
MSKASDISAAIPATDAECTLVHNTFLNATLPICGLPTHTVRKARRSQRALQWFDSEDVKALRQQKNERTCAVKCTSHKERDGEFQTKELGQCRETPKPILRNKTPVVAIDGLMSKVSMRHHLLVVTGPSCGAGNIQAFADQLKLSIQIPHNSSKMQYRILAGIRGAADAQSDKYQSSQSYSRHSFRLKKL